MTPPGSEPAPDHPGPADLVLDDDRLWLPTTVGSAATYDVVINGLAAWSVNPSRDAGGDPAHGVPWPSPLKRLLRGRAVVELVEHTGQRVLARTEHVFAAAPDQVVSITERDGTPLVVDKWGRLVRPLSSESAGVLDELLDQTELLLETITTELGLPAFICYGTLLGAVRGGKVIGHDNDIDVAYASGASHPVDINRETMRVERVLRNAGWEVRRGSGVRLNVVLTLSDDSTRFVDVFSACWVEGVLYIPSDFGVEVGREKVLPLTTVELEGRQLPAPAQPEELLALTYGPSWRVPDPSFRFDRPPGLARHFDGWFGGLSLYRKHWDAFGQTAHSDVPHEPTGFARWVHEHHAASGGVLVDLGAGTARDSLWFAEQGREVLAVDYAPGAARRGVRRAGRRQRPGCERVEIEVVNLYDLRAVLTFGARLARTTEPADLYARFLLHNLTPVGADHLMRLASMSLRRGGRLFLEFRTPTDRWVPRHFKHGGRFFRQVEEVTALIEQHGGRVESHYSGRGLARFAEEDPEVCRMVARWDEAVRP